MTHPGRSAVAIRHLAFEDLGLLAPILADAGWTVSYRDAATESLTDPLIEDADLLIVLGGPIGVYETPAYPFLAVETALLERRLARAQPTLGICLGGQLMAKALGARVFPGPQKEIGWGTVTLTEPGRSSCLRALANPGAAVLHWHGDTFDLPDGATRLASNAFYDNQAFAYAETALGLQFHLEADPHRLEAWFVGHAVELAGAGLSVQDLRRQTAAIAGGLRQQAEAVFQTWLDGISHAPR